MRLREYQEQNIREIRQHFSSGGRSALWQLPTGGGKTAGATYMASGAASRGRTVWFLCHRRELAQQSSETFREAGLYHSMIASGATTVLGSRVYVVLVDTVRRRLKHMRPPDLAIWDECHHLCAKTWRQLFDWMPATKHVGLSATPWRNSGEGLGDFFEIMVCGPQPSWLIENGFLSKYRLFGTKDEPDVSNVKRVHGDFSKKDLLEIMDKPKIVGESVDHYMKLANGRSFLLFDVSVATSEKQAQAFRDAGVPVMHVDATTPDIDRRRAIKDLETGQLRGLCNVDLFGEGVSVNNVSCIIQKRATESLALHLQQIGRGLRMSPGKTDCLILDQVGNWHRHGLPDQDRAWSLDGRDRKTKGPKDADAARQCESCFAAYPAVQHKCPECGWMPAAKPRKVDTVDGDLAEVDTAAVRKRAPEVVQRLAEQGNARSLEKLVELGRMRGMKNPEGWARHVMEARGRKRA